MNGNNIKLYKLLKNNLQMADNNAGEFVDVLDAIIQSDIKGSAMEYKSFVKEELAEIDNRMGKLDNRMDKLDNRMDKLDAKIDKVDAKIDKVDTKIDLRISELRGDLRVEIKETKIDTIKWMVGIFLALALMVIGLYFKK
jgi:uncharacterized coiled-coil DUF342 family protein